METQTTNWEPAAPQTALFPPLHTPQLCKWPHASMLVSCWHNRSHNKLSLFLQSGVATIVFQQMIPCWAQSPTPHNYSSACCPSHQHDNGWNNQWLRSTQMNVIWPTGLQLKPLATNKAVPLLILKVSFGIHPGFLLHSYVLVQRSNKRGGHSLGFWRT